MRLEHYLSVPHFMPEGMAAMDAEFEPALLLGRAGRFAVLAAERFSNTGISTLDGDIGLCGDPAIHGMGGLVQTGVVHQAGAFACAALADATVAFHALAGLPGAVDMTGHDMGGRTLRPGVYRFASSARLTGTLVLDAGDVADAQFVFQIAGAFTVAPGAKVSVVGDDGTAGVYWQVGTSATLHQHSCFAGTLLAGQDVDVLEAASIRNGRAIALNGALHLHGNTVSCSPATLHRAGDDPDRHPGGDAHGEAPGAARFTTLGRLFAGFFAHRPPVRKAVRDTPQ